MWGDAVWSSLMSLGPINLKHHELTPATHSLPPSTPVLLSVQLATMLAARMGLVAALLQTPAAQW